MKFRVSERRKEEGTEEGNARVCLFIATDLTTAHLGCCRDYTARNIANADPGVMMICWNDCLQVFVITLTSACILSCLRVLRVVHEEAKSQGLIHRFCWSMCRVTAVVLDASCS
jgi:hypothetical protein